MANSSSSAISSLLALPSGWMIFISPEKVFSKPVWSRVETSELISKNGL